MQKSKLIFIIIAVILVGIILLVVFLPKLQGNDPTIPGGSTSSSTPYSSTPDTEPPLSYPVYTGPTLALVPTDPTYPRETFVPDEDLYSELPPSDGAYYGNVYSVSIPMRWHYPLETKFRISFGIDVDEPAANCIYLNPSIYVTQYANERNKDWYESFQLLFVPKDGCVVTVADQEPGPSDGIGCVTFARAFDYSLPAEYVDAEHPGVVWFMPEGESLENGESTYIDVLVYANGSMLASLRLEVDRFRDKYCLGSIINLNQLENAGTSVNKLSEDQLNTLIDLAWQDGYNEDYDCGLGADITTEYTKDDFLIEWREPGQGTYFSYTSAPEDMLQFISSDDLDDTPLIAVTHRRNRWYVQFAPVTLYYKIVENADGVETFELVGIDHHFFYRSYYLYYGGYPGYSLPDNN